MMKLNMDTLLKVANPLMLWMTTNGNNQTNQIDWKSFKKLCEHLEANTKLDLQLCFYEVEDKFYESWNQTNRAQYQGVVGHFACKVHAPLLMPIDDTPYWLRKIKEEPLYKFRSTPKLPKVVDVVVIGAGLTGASAAYHLKDSGLKVVLLEAGDHPAFEASGKNGGAFEAISELHIGEYDGQVQERVEALLAHSERLTPLEKRDRQALEKRADYEARHILEFIYQNLQRFLEVIKKERIDCDLSTNGWLQIAESREDYESMLKDCDLFNQENQQGQLTKTTMTTLSVDQIREKYGLHTNLPGRLFSPSGTYNPQKFICRLIETTLRQKNVSFYTKARVSSIDEDSDEDFVHILMEDGNVIQTKRVIVAANAFTPKLIPELEGIIRCHPSQIMNLTRVENKMGGCMITEKAGDIYYQILKNSDNMLHYGLDFPDIIPNVDLLQRSDKVYQRMLRLVHSQFPTTHAQPPISCHAGPMTDSSDKNPIIGFRSNNRRKVIIVSCFNGFGGSGCIQAGYVASYMSLTGIVHSTCNQQIYGMERFFLNK